MNAFDIAIVAVLLISAGMAFARGGTRELLTIGTWVGAALLTPLVFPVAKPLLRSLIDYRLLADGITIAVLYIALVSGLTLLNHRLSRLVQDSALGPLDRILGLAFGLARGALLLAAAFLAADWFLAERELPGWIAEARTLPALERGAATLEDFAGALFAERESAAHAQSGGGDSGAGYERSAREGLDRLIKQAN